MKQETNAGVASELRRSLSGIDQLYSDNLKVHGVGSKSVGWKDDESHRLRFQQLVQVVHPSMTRGISVNDYGCGYAAMFRYLDELPSVQINHYNGYDINAQMLSAAADHVADDPRAHFIQGQSVTEVADYSFASGTFNVKLAASDESWAEHVKESLMSLAERSTLGLSFNLLTSYVDWRQETLYYADPLVYFDFCQRHISRHVKLIHDYPLYEWTICVRKES